MVKFDMTNFFFFNNYINVGLFVIWIGLFIYTMVVISKSVEDDVKFDRENPNLSPQQKQEKKNNLPPEQIEKQIKKDNEFTYVTTLFCIFTLLNYFRYFPREWPKNNLMMGFNWFLALASLTGIFIIINKNKFNEYGEKYKTKFLPILGVLITLSVYTIHTGLLKIKEAVPEIKSNGYGLLK